MAKCIDCGLLDRAGKEGVYRCVRFAKDVPAAESEFEIKCDYFMDIISEEGNRLSPAQHLLIQDGEHRSRKMRGPI